MSEPAHPRAKHRPVIRLWGVLALFAGLTVLMLYPLSVSLATMVPEPTDPLLNAWRMQWNARAFLGGPQAIANIFNTNIFYPFPLTLAYSEHFIMLSLQALPFLLLADSHLVGMNLSVLVTFVLSGYAMYLLVTGWTGDRRAGIIAGLLFAFSPLRFGQINHLELLAMQWMPLALLALHWTLTRPGRRYPLLFIIFFNVQMLSGFHYGLNLTIACVVLSVAYLMLGKIDWRPGLWLAAVIAILTTLLLNWPIWRVYLHFSDVMGAVRTPGEVRIYSAALTDYLTTIPHNLLYGFTFGRWQAADHQFQVLMPFGLAGLLLVLLAWAGWRQTGGIPKQWGLAQLLFGVMLAGAGLLLSFGLNENALGVQVASLLKRSPYFWLYNHFSVLRGIRVPGRFGLLVLLGLSGLAGWGTVALTRRFSRFKVLGPVLVGLILLESWSMPLAGPQFPGGAQIPPVYRWLSNHTPADAVVLELPYQDASEFQYEYYSSYHWRPLVNGGTGYTPPVYKELRQWFSNFPDARSLDILQQLGVDYVILHSGAYPSEKWTQIQQDLPRYWFAVQDVQTVGEALVLKLGTPRCLPSPANIKVDFQPAMLDGLPNGLAVGFENTGPAAFVSDVRQVSHLNFAGGAVKNFTEPLVVLPGARQRVTVPLTGETLPADLDTAYLASLQRTVSAAEPSPLFRAPVADWPRQPLGLAFVDGPQLAAYRISATEAPPCTMVGLALEWVGGQPDDRALVQLTDPFGRVVFESVTQPWVDAAHASLDIHWLPLPGATPPGQYGLRVWVQNAAGEARWPMTGEGVPLPPNQLPPLPLLIHPPQASTPATPVAIFENGVQLWPAELASAPVHPGDWLRFNLTWQVERPVETGVTVFTQLLGPDGRVWGQYDNQPGGGWYPFALWPANRPTSESYAFQLPVDAPPGEYRLIAGMYDAASGERVSIVDGPGQGQDFVTLAVVTVSD